MFGGYIVTRKIGEGGMGVVYVAENRDLDKKLAIKVLLPERSTNRNATARFLAEARAASAIHHRNIIDIIDSSTLADGRHYILMEYLEGTTLRRYARGIGPMPIDVVLAIMGQVCSGLQAAHDRGIVHRDLKPSNIFLAPQPDNPYFAKILDFGIAKLDDPVLAGDIHTKSHTVAGTPNYMAPEQARALRDVDHRADVYSVGAIIYELLTGELPYRAASIGDLTYKQASTTPATVSQLRADIPAAWSDLVMRAIALELPDRTPSTAELAHEMMRATPHGEAIARATASLLFAPPSSMGSRRRQRSRSARRPPSMPPISETISVVDVIASEPDVAFDDPLPDQEVTRAATPMALSKTQLPRIPEAPATQSTSWPSPLSPAAPPRRRSSSSLPPLAAPAPEPAREVPTTLGMSASQMDVRTVTGSRAPWAWIVAALFLLAAAGGIALVISASGGTAATGEVDSAATPATRPAAIDAGQPLIEPLRMDAAPPVLDAAAPADAARRRPARTKREREPEPRDEELFKTRK